MNKYEIIGIVGEGAYGVVYKAKNKETGEFGKHSYEINAVQLRLRSLRNQQRKTRSLRKPLSEKLKC